MGAGTLDILGFGASAIDDLIYVDAPLGAGKGKVLRREMDYGGNVATALVAAAKLGGRTGFVGWLGVGEASLAASLELERHGVNVSIAPRRPDASPIRSVIVVGADGDRFIAYDDNVPHGTSSELSDAVLSMARVLLVDGYAIHSPEAVSRARSKGLAVVADIEWSAGAATRQLLNEADHLVLPMGGARNLSGEQEVSEILRKLWTIDRAAVVLTDGENGSFVKQNDEAAYWHVPAYDVVPVDTTGAGDCFHGAYALALAQGKSLLDCVLFASAAAAISVTGRGGRKALPDRKVLQAWLGGRISPRPIYMAG